MIEATDDELDELDEALHRAKEIAEESGIAVTWDATIEELSREFDRRARLVIL